MYYEERLIGNKLMWRGTPDGKWQDFTLEALSKRVVEAEYKLAHIERKMAA